MKIKKLLALITLFAVIGSLFGCVPGGNLPEQTTSVGSGHFSVLSVSEVMMGGSTAARVSVLSDISLISYSVTVSLLDKDGTEILSHNDYGSETVSAGATFSVYIPLGEVSYETIKSAEVTGYGETHDISGEYLLKPLPRVTFMCGSTPWAKQSAEANEPIPCPDTPVISGKIFEGWYADEEFKVTFDFAKGITQDTVAYAKITDDVGETVNRITKELMKSIVTVRAIYTEDKYFAPSTMTSTSSGVIIRTGTVSYILTNCHSTTLIEGYKSMKIEVEDCFGNVHSASLVENSKGLASDPAYDLSILEVYGMTESLAAIELATENPTVGTDVYSLGSPAGQSNAITVGEITNFINVKLDAEAYLTNVEFGVFAHTAEVRRGSSGGALVNSSLELVGINFAGKGGEQFSPGYAIPINKVHEFIEKYM